MTDRDTGRDGQDARITDGTDLAGLRADGPESAAQALPDLRPRGLQVSQPEADFLARLGPLLPTPRAAKRLVNLYRLVRISIPEAELTEFAGTGGGAPHQVVQVLLAILVGSPAAAVRVFREITDAPADGDIRTVLAKLGAEVRRTGSAPPLARWWNSWRRTRRWSPRPAPTSSGARGWRGTASIRGSLRPGLAGWRPGSNDG
jgi:hypothetical protein